ncbi:hypothetical protein JCM3775_004147 [Rhodotorula graminis]
MSWYDAPAPSSSSTLGGYRRPSSSVSSLAAPQAMKRTASMCSLPSPPADYGYDGMDVDEGLRCAPRVPHFGAGAGAGAALDSDEVDQLASSDDDDEVAPSVHHGRTKVRASRPCMLGSPAVLLGGGAGAGLASRKQLLNPFLPPAASTSTSTSTSSHPPAAPAHGAPPLSPSASPVRPLRRQPQHPSPSRRRAHHRPDPDRIRLTTPPPRPSAAELELERRRAERDERLRAMGWEDPENPFVERGDEMARRLRDAKPVERPETITYVKRGQRIRTSVPFTAVLTSSSPSDDPFTFTAPKLLFPPAQPPSPTLPSTPPKQSKFLEALRAAGGAGPAAGKNKDDHHDGGAAAAAAAARELPPTPATLKRKAHAPGAAAAAAAAGEHGGGVQHKRARMFGGGPDGAEHRGLR